MATGPRMDLDARNPSEPIIVNKTMGEKKDLRTDPSRDSTLTVFINTRSGMRSRVDFAAFPRAVSFATQRAESSEVELVQVFRGDKIVWDSTGQGPSRDAGAFQKNNGQK